MPPEIRVKMRQATSGIEGSSQRACGRSVIQHVSLLMDTANREKEPNLAWRLEQS